MEADRKRRYAVMAVALAELEEDEPRSCKRTCCVRPYISRKDLGVQNLLLKEVLQNNPEEYRRLLRVSHDQFQELLSRVGPRTVGVPHGRKLLY